MLVIRIVHRATELWRVVIGVDLFVYMSVSSHLFLFFVWCVSTHFSSLSSLTLLSLSLLSDTGTRTSSPCKARRSEEEAVAAETPDPQCRGSRQRCAEVGRPPILPPFPFENASLWCWLECQLSPCFWSLDYLPLEYCLMMTVNVLQTKDQKQGAVSRAKMQRFSLKQEKIWQGGQNMLKTCSMNQDLTTQSK